MILSLGGLIFRRAKVFSQAGVGVEVEEAYYQNCIVTCEMNFVIFFSSCASKLSFESNVHMSQMTSSLQTVAHHTPIITIAFLNGRMCSN